jgi:hypothetical protein
MMCPPEQVVAAFERDLLAEVAVLTPKGPEEGPRNRPQDSCLAPLLDGPAV